MPELHMAWSSLGPGQRVFWVTPKFAKMGTVQQVKGRSARILFDTELRPTIIPDARWYWAQAKTGDKENSLVAWDGPLSSPTPAPTSDSDPDYLSTTDAVALFGVAPKDLRRWLRSGKVAGHQRSGLWVVDTKSLGQYLSERSST